MLFEHKGMFIHHGCSYVYCRDVFSVLFRKRTKDVLVNNKILPCWVRGNTGKPLDCWLLLRRCGGVADEHTRSDRRPALPTSVRACAGERPVADEGVSSLPRKHWRETRSPANLKQTWRRQTYTHGRRRGRPRPPASRQRARRRPAVRSRGIGEEKVRLQPRSPQP